MQISDVAAQIMFKEPEGLIVASQDVRATISNFVRATFERREAAAANAIETVANKIYESGADEAYLVNFRLVGSDKIVLSCGDNYANNHAIVSFRAGTMVDFHPMPIFNANEKVRLYG